ncbi:related to GEF1 protein [Melanopsichium pennsylvanicum]|uniref:Related to GEF1 protein n=2 Tax=Melanopsichium pennsylvanicum TaxID=63383 RepID=A0AAJ4XLC2_9BASI|nr:related to GEF1 protein [Melanopsichium pennsylvanicum 4]SNX84695.1 related to GEF1 protein [Melanopsichium pennsylvanicum]
MPPRDCHDPSIHPRRSLPTPWTTRQPSYVSPTYPAATGYEHHSQQRFTLPLVPAAAQGRSSTFHHPAYSSSNSLTRPATAFPAGVRLDSKHSYRVGCRVPSSLSQECHLDLRYDKDSNSSDTSEKPTSSHSSYSRPIPPYRYTCARLATTPEVSSGFASMSATASIDLLPPMGSANGMHSPFSIPHPLFDHGAAPSSRTFATSPPSFAHSRPLPSPSDNNARVNAALLDALAGPSSGMSSSSSSGSLSKANPSSLDLSQNAGSSLGAGSGFGSSGAYSGSNSSAFGNPATSSGNSGGAAGRDESQRDSGFGDGGGSGGNGDDIPKDTSDKDKAKKTNPLVDLLETEAAYVSELSKIIKKVAAAWSRSNFPPPELDTMFRNVESIYRANRSFLKALKEIGPNPSSPKALGDLLMKWIDDLEAPYSRFCESYLADFDAWSAVQSNPRLSQLLQEVSGATDADGNPVIFSDRKRDSTEPWTLDSLFALPHIRLKYYKKLYSRLLKSTQPGRSDHRLLVGANKKLDELLDKSKRRLAVSVLDEVTGRESRDSSFAESNLTGEASSCDRVSSATSTSETQSPRVHPVQRMRSKNSPTRAPPATVPGNGGSSIGPSAPPSTLLPSAGRAPTPAGLPMFGSAPPTAQLNGLSLEPSISPSRPDLIRGNSEVASVHDSGSQTAGEDSASTRTNSLSQPIELLEKRLDTSKTLDIFTMKPKKCQLQINPPNLPFSRSLRKSADVVIHFTPSSGGPEISIRRAHIFLLTDLFLVCERMTPSEKAELSKGGVGPDMWLLYPPLAGKHLRVADMGGQGNTLSITILKKEKLIVNTDSREAKDEWLEHFADCHKFAANLGLKLKTGGSAVPTISGNSSMSASSLGSGQSSLFTPALSPAISVTPSSTHGHEDEATAPAPFSPEGGSSPVIGSDLSRQASFNSVASFPKVAALGSPDLGSMPPGSNSGFSPRSPSPSQFGPGGGPGGFGGPRPPMQRPPSPMGMPRPGMSSYQNGAFSPDTSPAFGPSRYGPGGFGPNGPNGPNGPMNMSRPPLMVDPNMPPRSPGAMSASSGMRTPGGGPMSFPRGGTSPIPGQMAPGGGPGNSPGFGPTHVRPGMGPGGPMPPFMNGPGGPRLPMPRPPPGGGPRGYGLPPPPPNSMGAREPLRRPSAPNLRQASHGSSNGDRTSDEAESGGRSFIRTRSVSSTGSTAPKLPSTMMKEGRDKSERGTDVSPPSSPVSKRQGPFRSTVSAQMRCKIFLKQSHAQWKSLGNARLKLYHILPDDVKQLVVENDRKTLISTIVLTDGVERVGKVGVAVELSDDGNRTGIVYMLQMRSEESAGGLFGQLLEGSDRTAAATSMGGSFV